jgi:hypothetical protein
MEIIKHGEPEKIAQYKFFKCLNCGCEFKADKNEYHCDYTIMSTEHYYCKCPDCGNYVDYLHHKSIN